jgi:tetratricopeptide (TPR) repeat protein
VAFSPDGRRLASASNDQTVRVWDAATGKELLTLKGHTGRVFSVSFSPDGRRLASAGFDRTVRVWEASLVPDAVWRRRGLVSQVHSLFEELRLREKVLVALRNDPYLDEADRGFALQVAQERGLVRQVHSLFEEIPLREEVLVALRKDPTLGESDREFALQVAQALPEVANPGELNEAAWKVVKARDAGKDVYARTLRLAEAAVHLAPGNGSILNTLGVAQYRAGRYADALATLTKSEKLNATKEGSLPADLAFLAMARHQLGNKDEAKATLGRLRETMKQPQGTEAVGFLREAEGLIEGRRYRIGGALEGEQLKVLGQSSDYDLGPQDMIGVKDSRWSSDAQLWAQPSQVGSWADLELPVAEAGKYEMIVYLTKARNYGIVQFHLDGKQLGKPIDCFEPEKVLRSGPLSLGTVTLKKGPATLRVEVVGTNPASEGLRTVWGLDCIVLKPVKP